MNEITTQEWYKELVQECKAIITEAVFNSNWALVEGYWNLGKRIREDSNKQPITILLQQVAVDLRQSERTLWYAVKCYDKYPDIQQIPEGKNINWKKLINKYLPDIRKESIENFEFKELPENLQIINNDFRKENIEENSIDCIITDPPYPEEYLPLYEDLAIFANKVLKPSGFCIAYAGHIHLDRVLNLMSKHLFYYWIFAMRQPGITKIVLPRYINALWKPILIYQKLPYKKVDHPIQDMFISEQSEKKGHVWQQSESGVKYLIEQFTKPNDLICDPFSGAGTFPKVAHELKRRAIGIEIDETFYKISLKRIYE
jgi:hypothetical protein